MGIEAKLSRDEAVVAIIGMGYVGLPLALNFARSGLRTLGVDIDAAKVSSLNSGRSYIQHIDSGQIAAARAAGTFEATADFSRLAGADAIIICVPTPLTKHRDPDLSYVVDTLESMLPHLKAGQLVSLESTTYPGTTEEELLPRIESLGFEVGRDFHVVYSPEREDPANPDHASVTIPKVVGGATPECLRIGGLVYGRVFQTLVPVSTPRTAEFTKLLENIYRAVNIGLVNEMKLVAERMDIDIWEVIAAAKTKPFGFTAFHPGPGLGGHCIPIDPFYLTWKAKAYGIHTRFIELAGEVNTSMPLHVIHHVIEVLNQRQKAVAGSRVLLLGMAYKGNVDDCRESPALTLMDLLAERGAQVAYHDPHVPAVPKTRDHPRWAGQKSLGWTAEEISGYDCTIIVTSHQAYRLDEIVAWCDPIIDTRNALGAIPTRPGQVVKA